VDRRKYFTLKIDRYVPLWYVRGIMKITEANNHPKKEKEKTK